MSASICLDAEFKDLLNYFIPKMVWRMFGYGVLAVSAKAGPFLS